MSFTGQIFSFSTKTTLFLFLSGIVPWLVISRKSLLDPNLSRFVQLLSLGDRFVFYTPGYKLLYLYFAKAIGSFF